jgi:type IV pilus assembly protein PilP
MTRLRCGVAVGALMLAACGSSEFQDLQTFTAESETELRGRVDPVPQVAMAEPVVYDAADLPDPFSPQRLAPPAAQQANMPAPRRPGPNEPLAAYPLESLTMVGTVARGGERWALIRTPENTIYRVTRGSFVGQQLGEVAAVSETSVTLHEYLQDAVTGRWSERVSSLQLQDGERS